METVFNGVMFVSLVIGLLSAFYAFLILFRKGHSIKDLITVKRIFKVKLAGKTEDLLISWKISGGKVSIYLGTKILGIFDSIAQLTDGKDIVLPDSQKLTVRWFRHGNQLFVYENEKSIAESGKDTNLHFTRASWAILILAAIELSNGISLWSKSSNPVLSVFFIFLFFCYIFCALASRLREFWAVLAALCLFIFDVCLDIIGTHFFQKAPLPHPYLDIIIASALLSTVFIHLKGNSLKVVHRPTSNPTNYSPKNFRRLPGNWIISIRLKYFLTVYGGSISLILTLLFIGSSLYKHSSEGLLSVFKSGDEAEFSYLPKWGGTQYLRLVVLKPENIAKIQCDWNVDLHRKACSGSEMLNIEWTATSSYGESFSGSDSASAFQDRNWKLLKNSVVRTVGEFTAKPNTEYRIKIKNQRELSGTYNASVEVIPAGILLFTTAVRPLLNIMLWVLLFLTGAGLVRMKMAFASRSANKVFEGKNQAG